MKTVEVLRAARKLIEAPWNWTQGSYCRDESGASEHLDSPEADSFCVIGACRAAAEASSTAGVSHPAEVALKAEMDYCALTWNDAPERTHAEVLAAFDKAIAAEEAK